MATAGLVVALAGLMATRPDVSGTAAVRLAFTVPEILGVVSVVVSGVAGLVVLLAVRRHRARRDALGRTSERLTWWARAVAELTPLAALLMVVAVLWLDGGRTANALLALGRALFPSPDGSSAPTADAPVRSVPWLGWAVGLFEVALALLALAVALALLFADRLANWWTADGGDAGDEAIADAVDDALDDLDDETDARRGILACYRRFEEATARARVRRAPWQTANEFMQDARGRLPLPASAVEQLTRLFELARFSHHAVPPTARARARECLADIRAALARRDAPHADA